MLAEQQEQQRQQPQIILPQVEPRGLEFVDGYVKNMVSVVMPAFNESRMIAKAIRDVKKMFESLELDYEIIVVDDGSTDDMSIVVGNLDDEKVRLVRYPVNKGKGYAFKTGFYHALGEYVFMMDSDSEVRPCDLRSFIRELQRSDIAIGSKRHPGSTVHSPATRRFFSTGLQALAKICTGIKISDTQTGFKAAKSRSVYKILPLMSVKRFAFDIEFLTIATMLGLKIGELPVEIDLKKLAGPNKIFRTFVDLLGITYRLRVRRWYQENMRGMEATYHPIIRWR
jgi:glycosyltransferase involved in cell wall biosynthesis